eukprot:11483076-Alexandrium_andersonii.AAC.1
MAVDQTALGPAPLSGRPAPVESSGLDGRARSQGESGDRPGAPGQTAAPRTQEIESGVAEG